MIVELRRSAFDTDLLLSDQSYQDLSMRVAPANVNDSVANPRRVEALQRDYERLGFQVRTARTRPSEGIILSRLGSSRADQRLPVRSTRRAVLAQSVLLLHPPEERFHSCAY